MNFHIRTVPKRKLGQFPRVKPPGFAVLLRLIYSITTKKEYWGQNSYYLEIGR